MKRLLPLLVWLPFISLPAVADESAKESLIQRLEAFDTVSADFEQTTYSDTYQTIDQVTGQLTVAKPLRFAWLVTAPYEQQVISDGELLWVYDPDLEQATYQSVNDSLQQSPAMILSQPRLVLESQYQVTAATAADFTSYRLYPINGETVFSEMEMTLDENGIDSIQILDSLGQSTVIQFFDFQANQSVDNSQFEFNPPPGTDLFEQM